jgi:hypothetical protein
MRRKRIRIGFDGEYGLWPDDQARVGREKVFGEVVRRC